MHLPIAEVWYQAKNGLTMRGSTPVLAQLLGTLLVLVLVLLAAWVILRWVNKRMPGLGGGAGSSRLVKVLDRVVVGKNSSILLLRVQDKVLLVAMTDHGAEKLCEFDDPDGTIAPPVATGQVPGFAAVLKDTAQKMMGKPAGSEKEPATPPDEEEKP